MVLELALLRGLRTSSSTATRLGARPRTVQSPFRPQDGGPTMLRGPEAFRSVVARLAPTRTVVCVVAQGDPFDERPMQLGVAATDPYLGHARALRPITVPRRTLVSKKLAWSPEELGAIQELAAVCDEVDAGAVAFALPLAGAAATEDAVAEREALVRLTRDFDSGPTMTYWSEALGAPFEAPRSLVGARHATQSRAKAARVPTLRCEVDDRLSLADVAQRRRDEPEIWSEVDGDGPSTDAAVALSEVLYAHSGGWRNTFG